MARCCWQHHEVCVHNLALDVTQQIFILWIFAFLLTIWYINLIWLFIAFCKPNAAPPFPRHKRPTAALLLCKHSCERFNYLLIKMHSLQISHLLKWVVYILYIHIILYNIDMCETQRHCCRFIAEQSEILQMNKIIDFVGIFIIIYTFFYHYCIFFLIKKKILYKFF